MRVPFRRTPLNDWDPVEQLAAAHNEHDAHRPEAKQPRKGSWGRPSKDITGPVDASVNTPKKGRRW
ncbi:hypothetical protein ACFY8W_12610 [Streptomyces sp. NPDC012637]|uniref:hypothetical protein n=1 Tax=Streptomyces sp. NPDC012637 TaxID=3364842 RepID=UPI0036ED97AE